MKKLCLMLLLAGLAVHSFGKTFDELSKELLPSPEKLKNASRDEQIKLTANGFSELLIRMLEEDLYEETLMMPIIRLSSFSPEIRKEFDTVFGKMVKELADLELTVNRITLVAALGEVLYERDELYQLFCKLNKDKKHFVLAEILYGTIKQRLLEGKEYNVCSQFTESPDVEFKKIAAEYKENLSSTLKHYEQLEKHGGGISFPNKGQAEKIVVSRAVKELLMTVSIYENSDRKNDGKKLRELFVGKFGENVVKEAERIERVLAKPAQVTKNCFVEFREVVDKVSDKSEKVKCVDDSEPTMTLSKVVSVSSKDIKKAAAARSGYGENFLINIRFTTEGAKKFGKLTEKIVGRRLAIVINGEITSAPTVNEAIYGGSAQITGRFSLEEARNLAASINANCGENYKGLKDKTK